MKIIEAIRERIAVILHKTQRNKLGVKWQYHRFLRWDRKADEARRRCLIARADAEELRKDAAIATGKGNLERAEELTVASQRKDRQANRQQRHAKKYRALAQAKVGRIKVLKRHIHKLDELARKAMDELEVESAKHLVKIQIREGKVTGGTEKSRFRTAALVASHRCLTGKRVNFYDQSGGWVLDKLFVGESQDERSDCSQFLTAVCWAAGLPDPNGTDWSWGYTGKEVEGHNGWHQVSEATMRKRGWGYVIYGTGTGFHVELYVGNGSDLTIGHGSAPIDPGQIDLLGDGNYRCFVLN